MASGRSVASLRRLLHLLIVGSSCRLSSGDLRCALGCCLQAAAAAAARQGAVRLARGRLLGTGVRWAVGSGNSSEAAFSNTCLILTQEEYLMPDIPASELVQVFHKHAEDAVAGIQLRLKEAGQMRQASGRKFKHFTYPVDSC